jgi:predicted lactoylglutathione lyase
MATAKTDPAPPNPRKLFVNMPVRDLKRSIDFFTQLGFTFNPKFTDDTATCMIVSEEAFVMLLVRDRFGDFTKNEICDTSAHTEALFALSCESRAEVDALMKTALAAGGKTAMPSQDYGFMYQTSFYDLDDHHWELFWMDPNADPSAMGDAS